MARKQLNKNVIIGVSLFGFIAVIAAATIMIRQLSLRDPEYFSQQAERLAAAGEWRQAAPFYLKAWERSEDPKHLVPFGQMMLNEGDVRSAVDAWHRALIRDPELVTAHVKMIELWMEVANIDGSTPNWSQLRDAAAKFLAVDETKSTPAERAMAHRAAGLAALNLLGVDQSDEKTGIGHLETATQLAPEVPDYPLDLAAFYVRANRVPEADRIFDALIEKYKEPSANGSKVRIALARHLASAAKRQFDEAERVFQEGIAFAQSDARAKLEAELAFAGFLSQQWARSVRDGREAAISDALLARTESVLKDCIAADAERFDGYVQLATIYTAARRHADVITICEQRLNRDFSRKGIESIRRRLGYFHLSLFASEASTAQAVAALGSGDRAKEAEWFGNAEKYLELARGEFPTHPRALAMAGHLKAAQGQDRAALNDLRAADEAFKAIGVVDWQNKMLLARQHLRLSEPGAALALLEGVHEQARAVRAGDSAFWLLFGQVLFLNNQLDRAMAMSDRVLQIDKENRDALQLKAWILERKGMLGDAGDLHARATGSDAGRAVMRFREQQKAGNLDAGVAILREALAKNPGDVRLVSNAVTALVEVKREDEAAAIVAQALQAKPDDPILKKLNLFTKRGLTSEQREQALFELIQAETDGFVRATELIGYYLRKNEPEKALEQTRTALGHMERRDTPQAQSANAIQRRSLLEQQLRLGIQLKDETAATQACEVAARDNVDGAEGRSLLGLYHLFRNEMEPAIRALREAVEKQPTDASSLTYLGHCMVHAGQLDDAKACFERAIRINPDEALAHRGLAAVAQSKGDKETYERSLAVCQRLTPNDPWVQAETLARKEQAEPEAAIRRREAELAQDPNNEEQLRRLAVLSELAKNTAKADEYTARLLKLLPDDEALVTSAAKYYRRTERPQQALELLTRFADSRPNAGQKAYAQVLIAAHYISQNDSAAAERTLLAAAETAATLAVAQSLAEFYLRTARHPEKARPWLDKAAELAKEAKSPQLPQILGARIACLLDRSINDTGLARRYAEELRTQFPDDLRGLFWDSEVHARAGDIEKAAATLTEYLKKSPDDAYVRLQRARLLLSLGRTAQAIEDLEHIKRHDPVALNLEPRLLLSQIHAKGGRNDVAIRELESLVQDAPDAPEPAEELARAYLLAKRIPDAERVVTARINRDGSVPQPRWLYLRGDIELATGQPDRALTDYKEAALREKNSEGAVGRVLQLYQRTGRFAEGTQYARTVLAEAVPGLAIQSKVALLTAKAGKNPEAVQLFRTAMSQAMRESLDSVRIVLEDFHAAFSAESAAKLLESTPCEPPLARANERLLARAYRSLGRTADAVAKLDQAVATAQTDMERAGLLYEKGEMYQIAGDASLARAAYEQSLKHDPNNWVALNNLAYLLAEKLGEYALALPYAREAVALNDTPDTLDTLGWVYFGMGNFPMAVAELSRAVRLNPNHGLILFHLGEAYRRSGQFLEAGDVFQRSTEIAKANKDQSLMDLITAAAEKNGQRQQGP